MPEFHIAFHVIDMDRVCGFHHIGLRVHDLDQAAHGVQAVREPVDHIDKGVHRAVDHVHVGDEEQQHTVCHLTLDHHPAACTQHDQIADRE